MTDDPKLSGTDEGVIDWVLAQGKIPGEVKESYPGTRTMQARLGKQKPTSLPAEATATTWQPASPASCSCLAAFRPRNATCSRVGVPPPLACVYCSYVTAIHPPIKDPTPIHPSNSPTKHNANRGQ